MESILHNKTFLSGEKSGFIQLFLGICGITLGIVFFFYIFLKVSQIYALFLLLPILFGIFLFRHGRKVLLNGKFKIDY